MVLVAFADFGVEGVEQDDAAVGDADVDDAAVIGRAFAIDEIAVGEFVDQTGDIRGAGDESGGKVERGDFFGPGCAKEAEGVVLLGGEIMAGEEFVFEQP